VATPTPAEKASLPKTCMTQKATAEASIRRAPVRCCIDRQEISGDRSFPLEVLRDIV
jgi:hypothetical protein